MVPQLTSDGKPYGPARYKRLVEECYFISKYTHTSYLDVLQMSPLEKDYIISFIQDEQKREQKQLEQLSQNKH